MSKNISVKKNLKINTQLLFSRTEKSVLQNIRTFNVDMLILNNVVIWEKPTEWFWEFVKTLEPSIQLPAKTEVAATNTRGTRAFINGENVPERGVNEFSPLVGLSVPKYVIHKGGRISFGSNRRKEVATGSGQDRGRAGAVPAIGRAGAGPVVTGQAKERNL